MGNKNKTISFRVNENAFEALRAIAEERDISLSAVFRDYVDSLVNHDGKVRVVPEKQVSETDEEEFPPKITVPKSFVREHERLELEAQHLRDQLEEHKRYITHLQDKLEEHEGDNVDDVIHLEDLDESRSEESYDERFRIG